MNFEARETEAYILGGFIANNDLLTEYIDKVKKQYFYNSFNQKIYETMITLYKKRMKFDELVLSEVLKNDIPLTHIATISATYLDDKTFKSNYKILVDNYKARELLKILNETQNKINPSEIDEVISSINENIMKLENKYSSSECKSLNDIQLDVISKIEEAYTKSNGQGCIDGIKTGFNMLDMATNGLKKKQYYVIGARPSMGKSAFSLELCNNIDESNSILYIQLDMTKESMCTRILASKTYIANRKLTRGELTDSDWERLAFKGKPRENLYIYDTPSTNVNDIRKVARRLKIQTSLDILIVDHIGKIKPHTKGSKYEQVSDISTDLKELAKELDVVLIVLCQLNRDVEKETDNIPRLSHLRGSGTIEEDADFIGLLYREGYYTDKKVTDGAKPRIYDELELLIQKNRDGITAPITFDYDLEHQRITEQFEK